MIRSLEDAWRWYEAVKKLVGWMDRMGRRYWSEEVGEQTLKETLHSAPHTELPDIQRGGLTGKGDGSE